LAASIYEFLDFHSFKFLNNKGAISIAMAEELASDEYVSSNRRQGRGYDFDKDVRELPGGTGWLNGCGMDL